MSHAQKLLKSNVSPSTHEEKWTRYIMQELIATGQCKNPSYHVIYAALKKYGKQDIEVISDLQAKLTRQEAVVIEILAKQTYVSASLSAGRRPSWKHIGVKGQKYWLEDAAKELKEALEQADN